MFSIGDKVVYPMHGAGIIETIEQKKILGETKAYYILHIAHGNMQVMVPVEGAGIGLRYIVTQEEVSDLKSVLSAPSSLMDENWNRRNRENMDKLKTGELKQVAEVVRNLARTDREKKLSTGEKKLLANAKQILASEIALVNGITEDEALNMIESNI